MSRGLCFGLRMPWGRVPSRHPHGSRHRWTSFVTPTNNSSIVVSTRGAMLVRPQCVGVLAIALLVGTAFSLSHRTAFAADSLHFTARERGTPPAGHVRKWLETTSDSIPPIDGALIADSPRGPSRVGSANWTLLPPPSRRAHTATYDPHRDRVLMVGGSDAAAGIWGYGRIEVWALSLSPETRWSAVHCEGTAPPGRIHHSMIYDPIRDRLIMFGGLANAGSVSYYDDLWELDLSSTPTWNRIVPEGEIPAPRYGASTIYDPVQDRLILFGGRGIYGTLGDAWYLDLGSPPRWRPLETGGPRPGARFFADFVYDSVLRRMVLFGGIHCPYECNEYLRDVWILRPSGTWEQLSPAGGPPPGRWEHEVVFDPDHHRVVAFIGDFVAGGSETWILELGTSPRWYVAAPHHSPPKRNGLAAVHDAARNRMIVLGGYGDPRAYADVWALSLNSELEWSEIVQVPHGREGLTATYDPRRNQIVVIGGVEFEGYASRTWVLSLTDGPRWGPLEPLEGSPPRAYHTAVLDRSRDRIVVFGGEGYGPVRNDVWVLSLEDMRWTELRPNGEAPIPRAEHVAVFDPIHDRMIVHGGRGMTRAERYGDAWELRLGSDPEWRRLEAHGDHPEPRYGHAAMFDPVRHTMVMIGGESAYLGIDREVWSLSLMGQPRWRVLDHPAASKPFGRFLHQVVYDPDRRQMLMLGGIELRFYDYFSANSVWALSLPPGRIWESIESFGPIPGRNANFGAVYDEDARRVVLTSGTQTLFSLWSMAWAGREQVTSPKK